MESSKLNNYSTDMYYGSSCTLHGASRQRQQIKIKKPNTPNEQGVCHTVPLPFYITKYLKAKEEF
jgi:hypothetical protein